MPGLGDLAKGLYDSLLNRNAPIHQDGVTYGPAMTRVGRTPLNFTDTEQKFTGGFYQPTAFTKGQIAINPTTKDEGDVHATIAHEDIHSILDKLDQSGQLEKMSKENPYFDKVADALNKTRAGDMYAEVPAYMGAYSPAFAKDVPADLRSMYTKYFQGQLAKADPDAAAKYAKIAAMDYQNNPMRIASPASQQATLNAPIASWFAGAPR